MTSKTSRLVALLAALSLIAAGGWFVSGLSDGDERRTAAGPRADAAPESDRPAVDLLGRTDAAGRPGAGTDATRDVLVADAPLGDDAPRAGGVLWTGRVAFPAGTPADERAEVLVLDRLARRAPVWDPSQETVERSVRSRAEVAADGTFTIDAPATGERWIELDARYCHLERPLALPAEPTASVVLTPSLGAWVVGRATPPRSVAVAGLEGAEVTLDRERDGMDFRRMMDENARDLRASVDGDAGFELRAVPPGRFTVRLSSAVSAPYEQEELALAAGQRLELTLPLEPGCLVAGRVVDQHGAPVADVLVRADRREEAGGRGFPMGRLGRRAPEARTDADGSFELAGVAPGSIQVEAEGAPLLEAVSKELELVAERPLRDLELSGTCGAPLRGRVVWSDGTPAEGAVVAPTPAGEGDDRRGSWRERNRLRTVRSTTDADGAFELRGLDPEARYELAATWDAREREDAARAPGGALVGRASSEALGLEDAPVELVLEPSRALRGFVRAPDGAPVGAFALKATPEGTNPWMARFGGAELVELEVEDPNGEFTLIGLADGVWKLDVTAEGFAPPTEGVTVEWPAALDGEPPVLVLVPEARVAVTVKDPTGAVVPGAEVRDQSTGWRESMRGEGRELAERTDAFGRLELRGLAAGRYELVAYSGEWAPSAPLELVLEPGDVERDVTLTLSRGGRIEGVLHDPDGDVEGRTLFLSGAGGPGDGGQLARTDAKGEFAFELVPAGSWNLIAPPADAMRGGAPSMAGLESETVEVLEGETTFVELGSPPAEPVRVTGRVLSGGEPVSGEVAFVPAGESYLDGLVGAEVAADGTYEVVLDGPGRYLATANVEGMRGRAVRASLEIAGDTTFDFVVPGGAVRGIVRQDGAPRSGVQVQVLADGPLPAGAMLGSMFDQTRTEDDGSYEVRGLSAGTYRVSVGGGFLWGGGSSGRAVRAGVEVAADATTDGVDFALESPGKIRVKVVGEAGTPVGRGTLFARDAAGRVVNPLSTLDRSSDGTFEVDGLSPGTYTVSFRGQTEASAESGPVGVRAGETTELELVAGVGTELAVRVVDDDGEPVDVAIEVLDDDGKAFHRMLALEGGFGPPSGGWTPGSETYGPLPPGSYTVRAVHADGRETSRSVKLKGQDERKLTLRLR